MKVNPISEQEADAQSSGLWPDGEYDYEIREASEETSAAGNSMIKLEVYIFDRDANRRMVFDYLVNSDGAAWKIRKFAASCGLLPQYEKGDLMANEIVGRTGRCKVGTQAARGEYPAKNVIRDFIKAAGVSIPVQRREKVVAGEIDDEIPF